VTLIQFLNTLLKAADILGRTVLDVMPGTEPYWVETYGRVAISGEPAFIENYSRELDKYFEVTVSRPAPGQFVTIFADISARKRAGIKLKSAYAKLDALWSVTSLEKTDTRTISDHILATITRMTGSNYGFYGFIDEEETGMTIHSWSGEAMKDCVMVDKPAYFVISESGVWAEAIRNREPLIANHYADPHTGKKGLPDGHVTLTKLLVVPHFSHGRIISVAAVANRLVDYNSEDITQITTFLTSIHALVESKRAEVVLRESEARFKAVSEYSHNSICLINEAGKIFWVNEAFLELGGYSREYMLEAASFVQFLAPESINFVTRNFSKFIQKEAYEHHYRFFFMRSDGQKRLCEKHMTDYESRSGERILAISMVDITEREQAQEQVRQLNRELEQRVNDRTALLTAANQELEAFSYSVSHDLRAPLRALDGFSAVLLEDYAGQLDEQAQKYLTRIRESSLRMGQLINDLLDLSRVTRAEFTRQPLDLSGLAQTIANELKSQAPQRQVEVNISPNMRVEGDANLIRILLENLLHNAFKFTGKCEQAAIQLGMLEQAGERVYFVRDNGAGFNMAYATKLFTPFQRLHGAQEYPGTGIGLSIVQRIIARHGGRIWPESGIGKGSTFYFTLGAMVDE